MGSNSQPINTQIITPVLVSAFPPEVLHHITSYLTTPEYGYLRLTCKPIEAALFQPFTREFFTKRQFMLTEFSLQALVDISKSRLSKHLTHVILGLERPRSISPRSDDRNEPAPDVATAQMRNRKLQEYVDHIALTNTCQDVEMLAESFRNLDNLETIGIRDFYSRSRVRDSPFREWRSYGVRTFEVETGTQLDVPYRPYAAMDVPPNQANYLSRLFVNILRALGKANARPKNFEVILRRTSLLDNAFHLPKYVESSTQPILANLRKIFLDLNTQLPCTYVGSNNSAQPCPNFFLQKFLLQLSQLEHLRLNFRLFDPQGAHEILSWFSKKASADTPTNLNRLCQPPADIHLDHLRQLDIGMATLEPRVLLAIFEKYQATLRVISLHRVNIIHSDSPATSRINLWTKVFGEMSKLNLKLTAINLSLLSQGQPGAQHIRMVTFNDSRDATSRAWGGADVGSALRDFTSHLAINRLNEDTDNGSDLDSESSGASDDSMDDAESIDDDDDDDDAVL